MSLSELKEREIWHDLPHIDDFQMWRQDSSIFPGEARYEGARTGAFVSGYFLGEVWHNDVKSMYPSIMIKCNFSPENMHFVEFKDYDPNGYVLTPTYVEIPDKALGKIVCIKIDEGDGVSRLMLGELMKQRQIMRDAGNNTGQTAMKLAANAVYGYNGMDWSAYGSYLVAIATCGVGRLILDTILKVFDDGVRMPMDAFALECDTDGVYSFGQNRKEQFMPRVLELFSAYPDEHQIRVDTKQYAGMICTGKKKNYVLMDLKGKITMTGNSLKGMGMPKVCKVALRAVAEAILHGGSIEVALALVRAQQHEIPMFEMTCRIGKDPKTYDPSTMYAKLLAQAPWMVSGEELRYVCVKRDDGYMYAPLGSQPEEELMAMLDHSYYDKRIVDAVARLIVPVRETIEEADIFAKLNIDKPKRRRKCSRCGTVGRTYTKDDEGVIVCDDCQ